MIPFISIALAAWEGYALLTGRRTVTDNAHRWPEGILVWAWWAMLGAHFLRDD
ncbi:MAG TPA: hypothetical protein VGR43_11720 [Dehalococcoidia bacterium]|nr:hypothetical protein [Dehalococcoidia bacterium]